MPIWCIAPSHELATGKCPTRTLARLRQVIGPEVIRDLQERLVAIARGHDVVKGRKLRVDTTVVETNIHYPTDSSLLGDGARVVTRTMKKIERKSGGLKQKIRDRMRTVKKRVVAIALASAAREDLCGVARRSCRNRTPPRWQSLASFSTSLLPLQPCPGAPRSASPSGLRPPGLPDRKAKTPAETKSHYLPPPDHPWRTPWKRTSLPCRKPDISTLR
jgi:hypothetical protein